MKTLLILNNSSSVDLVVDLLEDSLVKARFQTTNGHYRVSLKEPWVNHQITIIHTMKNPECIMCGEEYDVVIFGMDPHDIPNDIMTTAKVGTIKWPGTERGVFAVDEVKCVADILQIIRSREVKGHPDYYRKLLPFDSEVIQEFYRSQLEIPEDGHNVAMVSNGAGTQISTGYTRVVVGDYGAYVEISPEQIEIGNIKQKWPGIPKRPVKYLWMETKDGMKTKVYHQQGTVSYADYKPGMYYVNAKFVKIELGPDDQDIDDLIF